MAARTWALFHISPAVPLIIHIDIDPELVWGSQKDFFGWGMLIGAYAREGFYGFRRVQPTGRKREVNRGLRMAATYLKRSELTCVIYACRKRRSKGAVHLEKREKNIK